MPISLMAVLEFVWLTLDMVVSNEKSKGKTHLLDIFINKYILTASCYDQLRGYMIYVHGLSLRDLFGTRN